MSQKKATIEELVTRLEEITGEMEHPDTGLEHSIKLYEEGVRIADLCKKKLQDARQKIEVISPDAAKKEPETPESGNDAGYDLFTEG